MKISPQFRKPSSSRKQTYPKYITSPPCVPIGCTMQEVGLLHLTLHYINYVKQTYLRTPIHTTQNFKWSRYTLITLNISQLQIFIYLLETAHPRTTKQLTRIYNTAYSTSHQTYHTHSSGDVNAHSTLLHSYIDYRGQLITDGISNSHRITLNTNKPTRVPNSTLQQTSSLGNHTVSNTMYNRLSWTTQHALSADYLPIINTIFLERKIYLINQQRKVYKYLQKAEHKDIRNITMKRRKKKEIMTTIS